MEFTYCSKIVFISASSCCFVPRAPRRLLRESCTVLESSPSSRCRAFLFHINRSCSAPITRRIRVKLLSIKCYALYLFVGLTRIHLIKLRRTSGLWRNDSLCLVASARQSGQEDFQRGTPPVSLASCSISPFLRGCIITE